MKRLSFDWYVRLGLGVLVMIVMLALRTSEVSLLNHLLAALGMWTLLVIAYEARALATSEFWYEYEASRAKLAVFRVVFFSLLALDSWRQIDHMARYGANDFNVSHLPWLDAVLPMPSSSGILIVYLLQAYLAVRVVLGVGVRASVKLLTVLYGYSYFISQVDSYQHHYFLFLLLLISCFVPWQRDAGAGASDEAPGAELIKSWAVRLLLVQLVVLYGWAAITKLDYLWLTGDAFAPPLKSTPWIDYYARNMPGELYATPAQLVMLAEAVLVLAVMNRRLWFLAIPAGLGLHIGIELAGFEIGLFSYYMMAMYVLVVPDKGYQLAARLLKGVSTGARDALHRAGDKLAGLGPASWAVIGAIVLAGTGLLWLLPFDEVTFVALVTVVIALSPLARRRSPGRAHVASAVAHVIGCGLLVVFFVTTDTTHEMYKNLAGSYRRLGDREAMYQAYAKLTQVSPDFGRSYHHMGHVLRERGEQWRAEAAKQKKNGDTAAAAESERKAVKLLQRAEEKYAEALAAYKRTHEKDPEDYWAYLWEALLHEEAGQRLVRAGKLDEARHRYRNAISAATATLRLKPKKGNVVRNARRIIQRARAIVQRMNPRPKRKRRRRRAPSRQSYQDP